MTPPAIRKPASRSLARDRRGATAVEFALVAGPFFLLMMAVLEVALVFFGTTVIEDAVAQAARDVRTGRLQNAGGDEADFRAAVCRRIDVIADCGQLKIDVRTFDDFDSADFRSPLTQDGELDDSGFRFDPGGPGEVVVVRVFYPWKLATPNLGLGMANMSDNRRLVSATNAFRNEPFR